jgi:hypothetical protein
VHDKYVNTAQCRNLAAPGCGNCMASVGWPKPVIFPHSPLSWRMGTHPLLMFLFAYRFQLALFLLQAILPEYTLTLIPVLIYPPLLADSNSHTTMLIKDPLGLDLVDLGGHDITRVIHVAHDATCVPTQRCNVNTPGSTHRCYTDLDGKQHINTDGFA